MIVWRKLIPRVFEGDITLQKNYVVALALSVILATSSTGLSIYLYSTFLSTYPAQWLPYWIMGESLTIFVFGNILSLYSPKNLPQYCQWMLSLVGLAIGLSLLLINIPLPWLPFTIVLALKGVFSLASASISGALPTFFYFRQYKSVLNRFAIASSTSVIISPLIMTPLTAYFGVSSILIFILVLLTLGIFCFKKATPVVLSQASKREKSKETAISPLRYPLFRHLLVLTLIVYILAECGEFLLKKQINLHFSQEQIAIFFSVYFSILNVFILGLQVLSPKILAKFKFYYVIQVGLGLIMLGGLVYWVFPLLWAVVFLDAINQLFDRGLNSLIRKNAISIFPPSLINKSEVYIKSYTGPIAGMVTATLALFSTRFEVVLRYFPSVFVILALVGIGIAYFVFKYYLETLKNMVVTLDFSKAGQNEKERKSVQQLVLNTLNQPQLSAFEVMLVTPKLFASPPMVFYNLLATDTSEAVKFAIIKVLDQYPEAMLDSVALMNLYHNCGLLSEANREAILKLLSHVHSSRLMTEAKNRIAAKHISKNALMILLKNGNTEDYIAAIDLTRRLAYSAQSSQRLIAAKLLDTIGMGRLYDVKEHLLTDNDPVIRATAFYHLPARDFQYMIPKVAKFFKRNIIKTLSQRFELEDLTAIAHRIFALYKENPVEYTKAAIVFILPIADQSLEKYIKDFFSLTKSSVRDLLAKQILERKRYVTFSPSLNKLLIEAMEFECKLIKQYQQLSALAELSHIACILHNRSYYAKQRFLMYYAALHTDMKSIYSTLANINPYHLNAGNKLIQDKAIEFLVVNETQASIRALIVEVFEGQPTVQLQQSSPSWQAILQSDPWLSQVLLQYPLDKENKMNPLQRTLALQQTEFFHSLPDEILFELGKSCELLECAPQQTILQEGEEGDSLYILVQGEVTIYKNKNFLASISGFQCFGEMALFGRNQRTATVIAKAHSLLLVLHKDEFMSITNEFPQILHNIIKIITERFLSQTEILSNNKKLL